MRMASCIIACTVGFEKFLIPCRVKQLQTCILQAAKACIVTDIRKDYKPYWTDKLNDEHNKLTTARGLAVKVLTTENNIELKK